MKEKFLSWQGTKRRELFLSCCGFDSYISFVGKKLLSAFGTVCSYHQEYQAGIPQLPPGVSSWQSVNLPQPKLRSIHSRKKPLMNYSVIPKSRVRKVSIFWHFYLFYCIMSENMCKVYIIVYKFWAPFFPNQHLVFFIKYFCSVTFWAIEGCQHSTPERVCFPCVELCGGHTGYTVVDYSVLGRYLGICI